MTHFKPITADVERLLLIGRTTADAYYYLKLEALICQFRHMAEEGDANAVEFLLGYERFAKLCEIASEGASKSKIG